MEPKSRRTRSRTICAVAFMVAGVGHFVAPGLYRGMMPPWLQAHDLLIAISGVAEFVGGAGLLFPRLRRAAGIGLIALLVAVFPANVQMLLDHRAGDGPLPMELLLWLRLPLQVVLIRWVWKVSKSGSTAVRAEPAA